MFALWVADKGGAKVQTIPVGGGGMVPALRAGQVDAIAMFPGLSLQLVASGEARSLMDLGKEMEPTLPDVIVASQEMMDKRPQAVRGTLAALYKTVAHLRNNRDWALKYLKEFTEEKDDKVNVLTYEQVVVPLSQDGMVKPEWIANSLTIAAKVWGLEQLRAVKPEDIYTNSFLPGARAESPAGPPHVTEWLVRLGPLLLLALVAALWEGASRLGLADPRLLPPLSEVLEVLAGAAPERALPRRPGGDPVGGRGRLRHRRPARPRRRLLSRREPRRLSHARRRRCTCCCRSRNRSFSRSSSSRSASASCRR